VVINEFLASNQSINRDMDGDYSDWIELYNPGSQPVDLSGYGLTDDPAVPFKWTLPAVTIQPGGYLLIWASGKNRSTPELHSSFKLSAAGETIALFNPSGSLIDQVSFPMQSSDISMARFPNGSGPFKTTAKPTPAAPNLYTNPGSGFIEILKPNGGETLIANTETIIQWRSSGTIGQIRLQYSTNGGASWNILDPATPDDGQKRWRVPNQPSSQCLIRATSLLDTLIYDQSNAFFQILPAPHGQPIVINELLASNSSVNTDEDGNFSDWFELYNPLSYDVNLLGYFVSDDPNLPLKWSFPSVTLPAGGYLVVWASGKDKRSGQLHTSFSLNANGEYLGLYGPDGTLIDEIHFGPQQSNIALARIPNGSGNFTQTAEPTPGSANQFREIITASLELTYPNGGETLYIGTTVRIRWRSTGNIDAVKLEYSTNGGSTWNLIDSYVLNDGSKSWRVPNVLSGRWKIRITALNDPQIHDESDANFQTAPPNRVSGDLVINEFMASNGNTIFDEDGDPSDWIEIYNKGTVPIDLGGYSLTDDLLDLNRWKFPAIQLPPGEFLIVWASGKNRKSGELHTSFRLNRSGESLILVNPRNEIVDEVHFGLQYQNISEARDPDGTGDFQLTMSPTPGTSNIIKRPPNGSLTIQPGSGLYTGTVSVQIQANLSGITIRYTTNGAAVTASSPVYSGTLTINATTVLRARGFLNDIPVTPEVSAFYLFDFQGHLPVLSIATDESNLYGSSGIFTNYDKKGKDWEVPAAVNFIEPDGGGFAILAGLRVHGQHSRSYPKKSVRLYFRKEYGKGKLEYRIFPDLDIDRFDVLVIHSGGSEDQYYSGMKWTLLRDPLIHRLHRKMGGFSSASRPILLFLNGEFYGIYFIRERIDWHYLRDHYGSVNPDLLKWRHNVVPEIQEGDRSAWMQFYQYFENHSFQSSSNYRWALQHMDIKNFTDYQLVEIYGGHKDWPHNNNFFFRERADTAKWRWILWDAEYTFFYKNIDLMAWASRSQPRTDISPRDDEGQIFATLIFRKLLENSEYRTYFMIRACDLLNTVLSRDSVWAEYIRLKSQIEKDIPLEEQRWSPMEYTWQDGIAVIEDFIRSRTGIVRYHIGRYFGKTERSRITLQTDPNQGFIKLNTISIRRFPWEGTYFDGLPITVEAIPHFGYEFVRWEGDLSSTRPKIQFTLQQNTTLTAVFRPRIRTGMLRISEFVPQNLSGLQDDSGQHHDWIELENLTGDSLNLSGCYLTDDPTSPKKWRFPQVWIPPHGYLVIFASGNDSSSATEIHTNFRLNRQGEFLGLLSPVGEYLDSLTYGSIPADVAFSRNPVSGVFELTRSPTPGSKNIILGVFSAIKGAIFYRHTAKQIDSVKVTLQTGGTQESFYATPNGFFCDSLSGNQTYLLTFSKPRGEDLHNALMLYDAALVARASVGLDSLPVSAKIAGDVNQDHALTLYDAALIARYVLHLPDMGGSQAGAWRFFPDSLRWNATWADTLTATVHGTILGDVDSSWSAPMPKPRQPNDIVALEQLSVTRDSVSLILRIKKQSGFIAFQAELMLPATVEFNKAWLIPPRNTFVLYNNKINNLLFIGGYSLSPEPPDSLKLALTFRNLSEMMHSPEFVLTRFIVDTEIAAEEMCLNRGRPGETVPQSIKIYPNYPNPFNGATTFRLDVPRKSHWRIQIFDLQGRLMFTLFDGVLEPGHHILTWNIPENRQMASGQYFVRFASRKFSRTLKILYMK
jgi:hypothetical protein